MRRNIEVYLPKNSGRYEEIKFIVREMDNYNPKETAEGLAELFECLYDQIPKEVMERLRADPRAINLRKRL